MVFYQRKKGNPLQPRTTEYEWGGPVGAATVLVFLPFIVICLNAVCNEDSCVVPKSLRELKGHLVDFHLEALTHLLEALFLELSWMVAHSLFYLCPIGRVVRGVPLRNGHVLEYRLNAIHAFVISHVVVFVLQYFGFVNLAYLCKIFPSLVLASIIITTIMSLELYFASYRTDEVLTALGGNSGNFFYDFWVGRELNPRTGFLDWKFMCELRPGLIGWSLLNWAFAIHAYQLGQLSASVVFIAFFHTFYVADGLLLEAGNLTMMDITTDGFGFMLCFGDLAWVPFTYTLQTKFLCHHPVFRPFYMQILSVVLVVFGYCIFRGANTQKDRFRSNPSDPRVSHLKVMKTSKKKSLLISSFWGWCRHPNYVGDWLMALGWASFTGRGALLPYFHPIYFGSLLIHRQLRDEEQMLHKYGEEDWKRFCSIVKYRLIPYVY